MKGFMVKNLLIMILLTGIVNANANEPQKLCSAELKKENVNTSVVKEQCLKAAKFYEKSGRIGESSIFYLYAGKWHKIFKLKKQIPASQKILVAFSRILRGKIPKAKEPFETFLKSASVPSADVVVKTTYKTLLKVYPQKKKVLNKGLKLWTKIYKPFEGIDSLYKKIDKLGYSQTEEKIKYYNEILSILNKSKLSNPNQISTVEMELGRLYGEKQEYSRASSYLVTEHILNFLSLSDYKKKYFVTFLYDDISEIYFKTYRYKELIEINKSIAKIYRQVHKRKPNKVAAFLFMEGLLYEMEGRHIEAIETYRQLLSLKNAVKNKREKFLIYKQIGLNYQHLSLFDNANSYLEKAYKILEQDSSTIKKRDIIELYGALADVNIQKKDYDKAHMYLNKILQIQDNDLASQLIVARTFYHIALAYQSMGGKRASHYVKKYFSTYMQLEDLIKKYEIKTNLPPNKDLQARFYQAMMNLYDAMSLFYKIDNKNKKALEYSRKVLNAAKQNTLINLNTVSVYYNQSQLYTSVQNYQEAYKLIKKSFDMFMKHKEKIFSQLTRQQKKQYLHYNIQIIDSLLENAYRYMHITNNKKTRKLVMQKTFNDWLNYKGSIFDSENIITALYASTTDKSLREKIDALMQAKRNLAYLYQTLPKTSEERKTYRTRIDENAKKIFELEKKIASKATAFKESLGLKKVSYKDIAKNLKDNELYIDFAKVGQKYYIFTLDSKEKITFRQIDKNATRKIDKNVKAFRDDIDTIVNSSKLSKEELGKLQQHSKDTLTKLYDLTLQEPLKDILPKYSNLIISPDGALRLLPFEALYDAKDSKYLIEEKNLKYTPSGKELIRLFKFAKKAKNKNQAVVIANPDFNKNVKAPEVDDNTSTPNTKRGAIIKSLFRMHFKPLPGTKQEAKEIEHTIKDTVELKEFTKDNATEQNLYKVNSPKFLHIATHGFFIKDNTIPNPMLKSGIALTGANTGAIKGNGVGIVTALKLSGMNLKGTDLVVLSACETGVVDVNSTESVSGLAKAFIQAGAKDMVMSLWSVDDKATKDLMTQFYKNISAGETYTTALKKAKLRMIKENMHPYYWAAFIMSGL